MCETNAFFKVAGGEEMLLESLARIVVDGEDLTLIGVFGDRKTVKGRIVEVNFQGGKVFIEKP